jgi:PGF-CTERM protein
MTDDDTETDSGEQDDGEDGTTDDSEDEPAGGGSDADSGTTGDDETEDQPGFGVFVTAVALLGVVLVAVRQTNR